MTEFIDHVAVQIGMALKFSHKRISRWVVRAEMRDGRLRNEILVYAWLPMEVSQGMYDKYMLNSYGNSKEIMVIESMSINDRRMDTSNSIVETQMEFILIHNRTTQHIFKALYRNNIVKPVKKVKHGK